jgi:hypothetical protein
MGGNELELHVLMESAGNEPNGHVQALDTVEGLKQLASSNGGGGDFYALTNKGKQEVAKLVESCSSAS